VLSALLGTVLGSRAQGATLPGPRPDPRRFFGRPDPSIPGNVPGELLINLLDNSQAANIKAQFGVEVKKLHFAPHTFLVSGIQVPLDQAARTLKDSPFGVVQVAPNRYLRPATLPQITPNDPLYRQQWALHAINATEAWGITVGERFVNGPRRTAVVGLIDFGPETFHQDLAENIDQQNGFDFVQDQQYFDDSISFSEGHGTNVAGCIAAVTNNLEGIASIPWEAVTILPCQVGERVTANNITSSLIQNANIVDAIYYCVQQRVDVINISSDFVQNPQVLDPVLAQAATDAYNQGIVLVAPSGNTTTNGNFFGVNYPARLPEVIAVGAIGPNGQVASYSNSGFDLELMAPGGNDVTVLDPTNTTGTVDPTREVLTTESANFNFFVDVPFGYNYAQGTSLAAGYVSGAIATLITQGARDESLTPTDQVEGIRTLLHNTASNGGNQGNFGFGVLDMAAALKQVTQYIDITTPELNEVTQSFSEPLEAQIVQPDKAPLTSDKFQVLQNDTDITDRIEIRNPDTGQIFYQPTPETRYQLGPNRINIIAKSDLFPADGDRSLEGPAEGHIPARAFRFRVQPKVLQPGVQMISIPYELQANTDTVSFLFGGDLVRLARWLPQENRYAIFDNQGSPQDPEAALKTGSSEVTDPPVGTGFWARIVSPTTVNLFGQTTSADVYEIPIHPGFNQIGNPYPFRVPWATVQVRSGRQILSIQEAARQGLMRNVIWRWETFPEGGGRYTFQAYPNGELREWESHWVQSFADLTLLVPRVRSNTNDSAQAFPGLPSVLTAGGGWRDGLFRLALLGQEPALETPPLPGASPQRLQPGFPAMLGRPALRTRKRETSPSSGAVQLSWSRSLAGSSARRTSPHPGA
jgi:hypothetical protein